MTTAVAALAIPGILWCSATQYRRYPHASACWARSRVLASAVAASLPSVMSERSSTERGVIQVPQAVRSSYGRSPDQASDAAWWRAWALARLPAERGMGNGVQKHYQTPSR